MGSYSNDSLFSPSTSFNSSSISGSTSCTPLANKNNRTTRSQPQTQPKQPVSVLRQPRNRSHVTLSTRYHENQSQFVDNSKREEGGCISDECHRMQKGDEGYNRGVLKQNSTSSKRVVGHSLNGVKDEQSMDDTLLFASTASSDGSNDKGSSSLLECDAWRKDGRERRMQILKEDENSGGSDFQIHHHSRLRTYSDIADRIRDQFLRAYASPDISVEELKCIYIMGNRLINFLSKVLPTHPQYSSKRPDHLRLQVKIQHDLMTVREKVEDVAYRLDKEFYRQQMEEQGLEFVKTPEKPNVRELRKERMKRVTFNLNLERIEYEPDVGYDEYDDNKYGAREDENAFDLQDLSVWEDKDPDDGDFIDMSLSSEDSSFENSFRNNDSMGEFGLNDDASNVEVEVLNIFGGMDDGWEHYGSNPEQHDGGQWEWPDMLPQYAKVAQGKDHDTTASTVDMENSSNEQDQHATDSLHSSIMYDSDESDTDSEGGNDYDVDDDFGSVNNFYSGFDESFVEKISRENFSRSIDELRDHDDDSAQDSWAQCNECDNDEKEISLDDEDPFIARQLFPEELENDRYVCRVPTDNDGNLQSLIGGHHFVAAEEHDLSMSSIDGPRKKTSSSNPLPRAQDLLCPLSKDESLEYSQSSLDFSYPSSKSSSKLYLSSCTEEWDTCDVESSNDLKGFDIHDEFDNSQIIAESPSFNDDSDSGNEYDEFVRNVSDEFGSQKGEGLHCDSSGGEKTVTTISTADISFDTGEGNSHGSPESGSNPGGESVLGILRRDSYIPTIDSPEKNRKQLGDNLDYLESKVKDLNIKNTHFQPRYVPNDVGSSMADDSKGAFGNPDFEAHHTSQQTENPSSIISSCNTSLRRHPTAARLKNLRQSAAWKRRYGK